MQKTYFHDRKHNSEKKDQKKTIPLQCIDQKRIVDINKLLFNWVILDCTKNKIYYKTMIIKWRGSSVG